MGSSAMGSMLSPPVLPKAGQCSVSQNQVFKNNGRAPAAPVLSSFKLYHSSAVLSRPIFAFSELFFDLPKLVRIFADSA